MSAKRYVVRGRVQGVNFRATAAQYALRLGLRGRIWNREDGAVEAEAVGPDDALARFEAWLHRGPSYATVESVEAEALAGEPRHSGFAID
ncbi:MAG TPA: acylphosphatase [Candidatus Saccharimonadales bacterium]|nr:acylphosphatase [Candidatus Saccharimonadales bacterium]